MPKKTIDSLLWNGVLTFHCLSSLTCFKREQQLYSVHVYDWFQPLIHHSGVEKIYCSGLLLGFPSASCFYPADYKVNCNKCTDPNGLQGEIKLEPILPLSSKENNKKFWYRSLSHTYTTTCTSTFHNNYWELWVRWPWTTKKIGQLYHTCILPDGCSSKEINTEYTSTLYIQFTLTAQWLTWHFLSLASIPLTGKLPQPSQGVPCQALNKTSMGKPKGKYLTFILLRSSS